jgi:predicted nucleic acid-binding protein
VILYLDSSAVVKLFVDEAEAQRVRDAVAASQVGVTHAIAYVETSAAFARVARERQDESLLPRLREQLDRQWDGWEIVEVTETLIRRAADLAGIHGLRGYDSVHLAAAEATQQWFAPAAEFRFAVFDSALKEAAQVHGLALLGE